MNKVKKMCFGCSKEQYIWANKDGNKFCISCWNKIKPQPLPKEKSKPLVIKKISEKRKFEQKIYSTERKLFLAKYPICQAGIKYICTYSSKEVHHSKGRVGNLYLDQNHWVALCSECHQYLELNPLIAKELGFSKSRLDI